MTIACNLCRQRKLKCSKTLPKCSNCNKYNIECIYTPRQKPEPLTKSYVQQLQRRIMLLEKFLSKVTSEKSMRLLLENYTTIANIGSVKNHKLLKNSYFDSHDDEESFRENIEPYKDENTKILEAEDILMYEDFCNVDDLYWYEKDSITGFSNWIDNKENIFENTSIGLLDGMGALSLDDKSTSTKNKTFYGISSSNGVLRFLETESNSMNKIKILLYQDRNHCKNSKPLLNKYDFEIFRDEDPDILLNNLAFRKDIIFSYFDNYHYSYPFIQKSSFLKEYDIFVRKKESKWDVLASSDFKEISFLALLYTVLAIGAFCKFGEQSSIDLLYYKKIKIILKEINIMEYASYHLLTAFLLLGNYTQKRNKPNTGWNYLGSSTRMAIGFGLHKEVHIIENLNTQNTQILETLERRRTLFWGLFSSDIYFTMSLGRPLNLPILESIDIKFPLNLDDESFQGVYEHSSISDLHKSYPTMYSGTLQEARFSKIAYKIYNYLTKANCHKGDNQVMILSDLLKMNKLIIDFSNSLPQYFNEDESIVIATLYNVCPSTWFLVKSDGTLGVPKWFSIARKRLIWRYKNLQIIMFRYCMWELRHEFDDQNGASGSELNNLLDLCIQNCYKSAKETINSIEEFVSNCEIDTISSWDATYFIFQAALIPLLLLYKERDKKINYHDINIWLADIEVSKKILKILQKYTTLAKHLEDKISNLVNPIIEMHNQYESSNLNIYESESKTNNLIENFESLTSTLNIDINYKDIFDVKTHGAKEEEYAYLKSESEKYNHSNYHMKLSSLNELSINNYIQELFPADSISSNNEYPLFTTLNFQDMA